jgi:phospholipase C
MGYFWTGTSSGWTSNPPDCTVEFTNVTTYPVLLLNAGISWQVYTNHAVGDDSGNNGSPASHAGAVAARAWNVSAARAPPIDLLLCKLFRL